MRALWYRLWNTRRTYLLVSLALSVFIFFIITEEGERFWPVLPIAAMYLSMMVGSTAIGLDQANFFLTFSKALPFTNRQVVGCYFITSLAAYAVSLVLGVALLLLRHHTLDAAIIPLFALLIGIGIGLTGLLLTAVFRFGSRIAQLLPVAFFILSYGGAQILKAVFAPEQLAHLGAQLQNLGPALCYGVLILGAMLYVIAFRYTVTVYQKQEG